MRHLRSFVNPFQFHKQTDKASQLFTEEFPKAKQFNIKMLFHPYEGFVAMRCDTIPEGSPSHSQITNHAAERMQNEEKKGEVLLLMAASQFTVLNDSRLLSFPSLCNTPEVILSNYCGTNESEAIASLGQLFAVLSSDRQTDTQPLLTSRELNY